MIIDSLIILVILINVIFLGLGNPMLPIWMFVNSFHLIVHAPLLSSYMPSNLSHFLMRYLNILRLFSRPIDNAIEVWMRDRSSYELLEDSNSEFTYLLNDCGYKNSFARNLVIIVTLLLTFLAINIILAIMDSISSCRNQAQARPN